MQIMCGRTNALLLARLSITWAISFVTKLILPCAYIQQAYLDGAAVSSFAGSVLRLARETFKFDA